MQFYSSVSEKYFVESWWNETYVTWGCRINCRCYFQRMKYEIVTLKTEQCKLLCPLSSGPPEKTASIISWIYWSRIEPLPDEQKSTEITSSLDNIPQRVLLSLELIFKMQLQYLPKHYENFAITCGLFPKAEFIRRMISDKYTRYYFWTSIW
jgi:hypothetical protein